VLLPSSCNTFSLGGEGEGGREDGKRLERPEFLSTGSSLFGGDSEAVLGNVSDEGRGPEKRERRGPSHYLVQTLREGENSGASSGYQQLVVGLVRRMKIERPKTECRKGDDHFT